MGPQHHLLGMRRVDDPAVGTIQDRRRRRVGRVNDGKTWCEGCREWKPTTAAFERHKPTCKGKDRLVEVRRHD